MKILVCGSRNWTNYKLIKGILDSYLLKCEDNEEVLTIIEGCAEGADRMAGNWADGKEGVEHICVPADWDTYGKKAGFIRNLKMLDMAPDLVLAFSNGTRGTQHTIDEARKRGIKVIVIGKECVR